MQGMIEAGAFEEVKPRVQSLYDSVMAEYGLAEKSE
jgi:hypothetical protein